MERLSEQRQRLWGEFKDLLAGSEMDIFRDSLSATCVEAANVVDLLGADLQRAIDLGHEVAGLEAEIAYWRMRQATASRLLSELFDFVQTRPEIVCAAGAA